MLPIVLRGARTHNLKQVSLTLRPGEVVAITGPSGAGKSSLAMDTLYAEGQRRFVESFSPYARQFLERLERPPIDALDPVAATVAVDRRAPVKSSRSTLATLADLEAYLAALYGAEAIPRCASCNVDAVPTTSADAAKRVCEAHEGARTIVSYQVRAESEDAYLNLREDLAKDGYRRLYVGGALRELDEVRPSEATEQGTTLEVVIDRVKAERREQKRLQAAIELAWARANGRAELRVEQGDGPAQRRVLGRGLACPSCGTSFELPRPALFSYNSPLGACEACRGFGRIIGVDWNKVIPDPEKSLAQGAIRAWNGSSAEWERKTLKLFAAKKKIPMDVPYRALTDAQREAVLAGEGGYDSGKYPGVRAWFKWLETRTYKMHVRVFLARYREYTACESCAGSRLNQTARRYLVGGKSLGDFHRCTIHQATTLLGQTPAVTPQGKVAHSELLGRLSFLHRVGLGYLTLDRQARTLSGGEAQRAALTTALGAQLTGTLFVLDEPTVGLHPSDVAKLAGTISDLAAAGNAVAVIEHDPQVIRAAHRVVELGPRAGHDGGTILFDGSPQELALRLDTPTGRAWAEAREPASAPTLSGKTLTLRGVREHNLKGFDLTVPLGCLVAICGPSGSGKSTLAEDVIYRAVASSTGATLTERAGAHDALEGARELKRAVLVDQAPLGRTARGNAATYTKAWDRFRARFAATTEARALGLSASHFSFNVAESRGDGAGRCETCAGEGYETVEMQFLADVQLLCPVCQGKRFKPSVLRATIEGGLNVAEVLLCTVDEVIQRFCTGDDYDPVLLRALAPVAKVGLGYLPLGQPLSTLSGGEAQRLKLARALSEPAKGTLFVVDEPSAGLHAEDVAHVLAALRALVQSGASVIIVEHDLELIARADHVIDMGPGGGPEGGQIVAEGTPAMLLRSDSRTGVALRDREKISRAGVKTRNQAKQTPPAQVTPMPTAITVTRASEHNLKNVNCQVPHGALTVITGPSGSGKSSLAFDVIFAEGQRRFMETLSPYARQFLPTLPRPKVESVLAVPPSIALEQRTSRAGANSTVATVTEIAHYLRLLYAKVGTAHCPRCDAPVRATTQDALLSRFAAGSPKTPFTVYSPAVRARKGTHLDVFSAAARAGVAAARVDGAIVATDPPPKLHKTQEHSVDLIVHYGPLPALTPVMLERALGWGNGSLRMHQGAPSAAPARGEEIASVERSCSNCGTGVPELDPRWFSFNTKQGQCESCEGSGRKNTEDPGAGPCTTCAGERLATIPRRVRLHGERYPEFAGRSVAQALERARRWAFDAHDRQIAEAPSAELLRRLSFVEEVGLGYLSLDRPANTLSGGEMQRLRLSAQLGSGLTGALYVLDEPTIGLHPRDTSRLITNLRALTKTGSTVLVVEHDEEIIRAADHVLDMGLTGGRGGGHIIAQGPSAIVLSDPLAPTAQALAAPRNATRPPRSERTPFLELRAATQNNLKGTTLRIPTRKLTVVCGVSGSGKSTLVRSVFYPTLRKALGLTAEHAGAHKDLLGAKHVRRALAVDQSPIGRTPRSVPATFLGIWDEIRKLYAQLPEAKMLGFGPARFSFNTPKGGRCTTCEGQGVIVHEMSFMPDVVSPCDACDGARFEPSTLDVRFKDLSIGDVLRMSAGDAAVVFASHPKIHKPMGTLAQLGVGYLQLGQGVATLSGGEAQRLKLAAELTAGTLHEPTVYVLDEPTTGLHLSDVRRLLGVLHALVDRGDTVVVIEHHPDVIRDADWVVELGPEAGERGGEVVFEGMVADLLAAGTATGTHLAAKRSAGGNPGKRRTSPRQRTST
jgi:excinuclease ABC subunit A